MTDKQHDELPVFYAANCLNQYTVVNRTIDQLVLRSLNEGGSNNLTYDADGNLLLDDRFTYSYDDENRLVSVTPLNPYPFNAVVNAYDHRNRRIRKDVWGYHEGDWRYQETHTFVWDGWNIVLEQIANGDQVIHTIEYFWGNDVSGTEEGAGGVGGLLATRIDGVFYIPVYGTNGNIMMYVDETGTIAAQFDYDPYGRVLVAPNYWENLWNFGFSTKYHDWETDLVAYQLRTYDSRHGRWLNRDPIGEEGGENLYVCALNNLVHEYDILGCSAYVFLYDTQDPLFKIWAQAERDRFLSKHRTHYRQEIPRRQDGNIEIWMVPFEGPTTFETLKSIKDVTYLASFGHGGGGNIWWNYYTKSDRNIHSIFVGIPGSVARNPATSKRVDFSAFDLQYDKCGFKIALYHCYSALSFVGNGSGGVRAIHEGETPSVLLPKTSVVRELKNYLGQKYNNEKFSVIGSEQGVNNGTLRNRGWPRPIGRIVEE